MANRFLYTNKIKTVQKTLVADQEDANYPASNLQSDNYTQPWRTTDVASAHNVVNDFGVGTLCDTVFLGNINLTTGSTVTIQGNATDAWGGPSFSEVLTVSALGGDLPHRNLWHEFASGQTFQFFRLLVNDATNPDGFYEVGEWWLGERITVALSEDFQSDLGVTIQRNNVTLQTEWLQKYVHTRADRLIFTLEYMPKSQAALDVLRTLEAKIKGTALPFVFVPDGDTTPSESYLVRLAGDFNYIQFQPNMWRVTFTFEEEGAGKIIPVVS